LRIRAVRDIPRVLNYASAPASRENYRQSQLSLSISLDERSNQETLPFPTSSARAKFFDVFLSADYADAYLSAANSAAIPRQFVWDMDQRTTDR